MPGPAESERDGRHFRFRQWTPSYPPSAGAWHLAAAAATTWHLAAGALPTPPARAGRGRFSSLLV